MDKAKRFLTKKNLLHLFTILIILVLLSQTSCDEIFIPTGPESPPDTPTGLSASNHYENYVTISWNPVSKATGYKIYCGTSSSGNFNLVSNVSSTYWNDVSVEQAKCYYYKVAAYSNAGESQQSSHVSGYRKGWRFDDVSIYDPPDGIGFYYDLYAFGFKKSTKELVIYAVYKSGSSYCFIPGNGKFGYVAYSVMKIPDYNESFWNDNRINLKDSAWPLSWRNNNYEQYIKMRIYKKCPISSLNDEYYDETEYYRIRWTPGALGKPQINIIEKLSIDQSRLIDALVDKNSTSNSEINFNEEAGDIKQGIEIEVNIN